MKNPLTFVASFVVVAWSASAQAAFIEYTDRTTWAAAAGPIIGSEDFNSFVVDTVFGPSSPIGLGGNMTLTALVDGIGLFENSIDAAPLFSTEHDVDGTSVAHVFNGQGGSPLSPLILFGTPIAAFGADFGNLNDDILRTQIEIYNGATLLETFTPSVEPEDTVRFWGFASNAGELVTELRFTRVTNDVFGMDNIEIAGTAVPEPSTLALWSLGAVSLTGLSWSRRKRAA